MSTPRDDLNRRRATTGWGESKENTLGVNIDGFADPSGEFPKRDYNHGSSVSKYSRGNQTVSLDTGGVSGVPTETGHKSAGSLPYNNAKETPSGHIIEINDTPGAESMTVKHRTGTGVELRPDGSMVIVTRRNRIEVVAADHSLVVEGDGAMTYKGNMTLNVSGDYNVNVGGDYKLNVAGDMSTDVFGDARRRVVKRDKEDIVGDQDIRIGGHRASLCLQDDFSAVKGKYERNVETSVEISSNNAMSLSAKTAFTVAAVNSSIVSRVMQLLAQTGTFGGNDVQHYGKTYTGPVGSQSGRPGSGVTFYGNLAGVAAEALTAQNAIRANFAHSAFWSTGADQANKALAANTATTSGGTGNAGPGGGTAPVAGTTSNLTTDPAYATTVTWANPSSIPAAHPNNDAVTAILNRSVAGVRNVMVDPDGGLADQLSKTTQYRGDFDRTPTEYEIRAKMRGRDPQSEDGTLTAQLVAEGRLSPEWDRLTPPGTNRIAGAAPSVQSGRTSIGVQTDPTTNKRFIPKP